MREVLGDCPLELTGQFFFLDRRMNLVMNFLTIFSSVKGVFNLLGRDMFFFLNVRNTHLLHENPHYLRYHFKKTDELCVSINLFLSVFSLIVAKTWFVFYIDTALQFNVFHSKSIFERHKNTRSILILQGKLRDTQNIKITQPCFSATFRNLFLIS